MRRLGIFLLLLTLLSLSACIAPDGSGKETTESADDTPPVTAPATESPKTDAQTEDFVFPFAPETDRSEIY